MGKIALTGDRPTGKLHLGHYVGSLNNRLNLQNDKSFDEIYVMLADGQGLTDNFNNPKKIRDNIVQVVLDYLAVGIDPNRVTICVQSALPALTELTFYYMNVVTVPRLERNPTVKAEMVLRGFNEGDEGLPVGFFTYPISQAADITAFDANVVPVGEDQKPMLEQCREIVHKFNTIYGETLVMPKGEMVKVGSRIMSLSDPTKKMSKSDPKGDIYLNDSLEVMRKKIMSAVTDMEAHVHYDVEKQPGISNLMTIMSALTGKSFEQIEKEFEGKGYGDFKRAVADAVCAEMEPYKARYEEIIKSGLVDQVLADGAKRASVVANATLKRVQKAVGLYNK